jgi:hypothetical protein
MCRCVEYLFIAAQKLLMKAMKRSEATSQGHAKRSICVRRQAVVDPSDSDNEGCCDSNSDKVINIVDVLLH